MQGTTHEESHHLDSNYYANKMRELAEGIKRIADQQATSTNASTFAQSHASYQPTAGVSSNFNSNVQEEDRNDGNDSSFINPEDTFYHSEGQPEYDRAEEGEEDESRFSNNSQEQQAHDYEREGNQDSNFMNSEEDFNHSQNEHDYDHEERLQNLLTIYPGAWEFIRDHYDPVTRRPYHNQDVRCYKCKLEGHRRKECPFRYLPVVNSLDEMEMD